MSNKQNDEWFENLAEKQAEMGVNYPNGVGYDNLFNAEHRALMIEQHQGTSAQWITIEELLLAL